MNFLVMEIIVYRLLNNFVLFFWQDFGFVILWSHYLLINYKMAKVKELDLSQWERLLVELVDKGGNPNIIWELSKKRVDKQSWVINTKKWTWWQLLSLWTQYALKEVKQSVTKRIEEADFQAKKELMFKISKSTEVFINNFWKLDKEYQILIVQYFFEWLEEEWMQDIISWERSPISDWPNNELRYIKWYLWELYSYYKQIKEAEDCLNWNNSEFKKDSCSIEQTWRNIELVLTKYWSRQFSLRGAIMDNAVSKIDLA